MARQDLLRSLPAVGALIESWRKTRGEEPGTRLLGYLARRIVEARRRGILEDRLRETPTLDDLMTELADEVRHWPRSGTCRVVNATGIVLHSGIGRALLPPRAVDELETLRHYCLLEVDKEDGKRRKRDAFCEELLCELTGAEAALVVNNNAAATMIILSTLARNREVVVSRSQLIEIGGSYRLPDVFEASGCRLREVGTTNKSYDHDYENAIGEETGALMLVHTSNYRIVGFTKHLKIDELVEIGRRHGLPVIDDLGSGCLVDLRPLGVDDEPPVPASVKAGADVVCFSGDKLIGGCQAGIIVGKKVWIDRIRKNPMARALRIDKTTCITLESTLKLYLEPEKLHETVPTMRMLTLDLETLRPRAESLRERLAGVLPADLDLEVVEDTSELGAGTLPTHGLPTACLALRVPGREPGELARALRMRRVPVFSRIKDERLLFDLRTLQKGDEELLEAALVELFADPEGTR